MVLLFKVLAEMGGTFALIFVGAGSILLAEKNLISPLCIPIAWGTMVCVLIIAMGSVSGAHFNPAVTLAFAAVKRIPFNQVWFYWASQLIGGLAAVGLLGVLNK